MFSSIKKNMFSISATVVLLFLVGCFGSGKNENSEGINSQPDNQSTDSSDQPELIPTSIDTSIPYCDNFSSKLICEEYTESYFPDKAKIKQIAISAQLPGVQGLTWFYLQKLEENQRMQISLPVDLTEKHYIIYSLEEKQRMLAAKIAQSLWLDKNNITPWQLAHYELNQLTSLFNLQTVFRGNTNVIDYSPTIAFEYIQQRGLMRANKEETTFAILEDLRTDFLHGIVNRDPQELTTLELALTDYNNVGARIARQGCHSMSGIIVGLLRSVNIAAEITNSGWFVNGHAEVLVTAVDKVIPHADDIYAAILKSVPTAEFMPSLGYYSENLNNIPCSGNTICLSGRYHAFNAIKYPSDYLMSAIRCGRDYNNCLSALNDLFSDFLTQEELQQAAEQLTQ